MTKHRSILVALTIAATLAFALSCATPPKAAVAPAPAPPTPAKVEPAPAPQASAVAPAPDDLRAKAAELRKKAFDLGIKDILPDDYALAEKVFADGNSAYGKDNAASAASFKDAASRYQDLIAKGLPILAANERKRAEDLRATAVSKRAGDLFPELFAFAESEFAKPSEAQAAGDFETAIAGFRASAKDYEVVYKLCDAKTARDAITARDFAKWDPSNWTLAETKFKAAQDLLRTDSSGAESSVDEAILRYGIASRTALEYYASDRKKSSETERDRASSIKSEVAVKDEFAAALALYTKAEAAQAAKDYESSSSLYDRAATAFGSAYAHAKVKMDTAKGELDSLDAAIATTEATAGAAR
jgi:hypothetical protein